MPVKNHIHKYEKSKLGKDYEVFKCILEDCSHFTPKNLVVGNKSICHVCGNEMIMRVYNLKEKRPRHRECRRKK